MGDREGTSTKERRGTGAEHLAAMVVTAGEEYEGVALRYHDGDDWTELSYPELRDAAREIAGGLIALGLEAKDRVAIFAETRMEWTLADLGAILAGIASCRSTTPPRRRRPTTCSRTRARRSSSVRTRRRWRRSGRRARTSRSST